MQISVFLTARALRADDLRGRTAVVIDVLRACSTVCTALANGARAVIPVSDPGEAGRMASALGSDHVVVGGERDAVAIPGTLGNSPLAYTPDVVEGKTLLLATTNGTPLFQAAVAADAVLAACLLNAHAVVDAAREAGRDVALLCAGWRGSAGVEDALCAGLLLDAWWGGTAPPDATDEAKMAHSFYVEHRHRLAEGVWESQHGRRLRGLDADLDVRYCSRLDLLPGIVPRLSNDGQLRLPSSGARRAVAA